MSRYLMSTLRCFRLISLCFFNFFLLILGFLLFLATTFLFLRTLQVLRKSSRNMKSILGSRLGVPSTRLTPLTPDNASFRASFKYSLLISTSVYYSCQFCLLPKGQRTHPIFVLPSENSPDIKQVLIILRGWLHLFSVLELEGMVVGVPNSINSLEFQQCTRRDQLCLG